MLQSTTCRALHHRLAVGQAEGRSPSMVGAVLRNSERLWSQAIESSIDTQYRIGSLTKTFVAILVMRLRDEGRLDLADPLEKHLGGSDIGGLNIVGQSTGKLTIGQLLAHTSGLASEPPGPWWERSPGDLRPSSGHVLGVVLGQNPIKHPVGRYFHYSNPGFAVLGKLIEKLRGKSWHTALQQEVLDPLEMTRTSILPQDPYARGWAVHPWADAVLPEAVQDVGSMAPAGQLWSTVEDLCRLATVLIGGAEDVLSLDTLEEMRRPHSAPDAGAWECSYGLGLQTFRAKGRMLVGHTGSMPGFLCGLWVNAKEQTGAVVVANVTTLGGTVSIGMLTADLLGIVTDHEPYIPTPWKPLSEVKSSILALTGVWYWGPEAYALKLEANDGLNLVPLSSKSSRGARFRPIMERKERDKTGSQAAGLHGTWIGCNDYFFGETLRVVVDKTTGQVTHLDIGSFVFTREPYHPDDVIPGGVDSGGWRGGL